MSGTTAASYAPDQAPAHARGRSGRYVAVPFSGQGLAALGGVLYATAPAPLRPVRAVLAGG
ncbi:hypothetical protein [Streptomyces sp. NPDC048560]|uniref:hypothetical protein n=1 Tax=Streptomyces sp. NPDC048560 TaxID=3155488 RepID=UPI00341EC908